MMSGRANAERPRGPRSGREVRGARGLGVEAGKTKGRGPAPLDTPITAHRISVCVCVLLPPLHTPSYSKLHMNGCGLVSSE
jgi:hypothetical protein